MRRTILILLALLAALLTLAAVQYVRRPDSSLAPLYDTYRHHPGLRTALIYDYPVDDSTTVDMLLLTSSDSAWPLFQQELDLMPLPPHVQKLIEEKRINPLEFHMAPIGHPEVMLSSVSGNAMPDFAAGKADSLLLVVVERSMQRVSIIEIDSFNKLKAVTKHRIEEKYPNNIKTSIS